MNPREVIADLERQRTMRGWALPHEFERADEILSGLESAGYAVVPIEPTEEMIKAVTWVSMGHVRGQNHAEETYRAMLAARPK